MIQVKSLKNYEIRKFMAFIKENKKGHIFSKNKKVINFFYNYNKSKETNMLSIIKNNEIIAAMGLIPYSNWSKQKNNKEIFIAFLFKSKKCLSTLSFYNYIFKKYNPNLLAAMNINPNTNGRIYNSISKLENYHHYYIKNPKIKCKISRHLKNTKYKVKSNSDVKLIVSKKIVDLPQSIYNPKKNINYFNNKYIKNPFYKYSIINIYNGNKIVLFFIYKVIHKKNSKFARIVDAYGNLNLKKNISNLLIDFLIKNNLEFIDFYFYSLKKIFISKLGFTKIRKEFIPYYTEPFNKKNFKLNISLIKNKPKNYVFYKGDGDGERPFKIN